MYKFKCSGCNACYIGQTKRHIHTRISEHIGISHLTGKRIADPKNSSVFDHAKVCPQKSIPKFDNFSVIASEQSEFCLKIKESLIIDINKPVLNVNVSSIDLKLF